MTKQLIKIICVKCKSSIVIKSVYDTDVVKYQLVFCPNCNTPIREVRAEMECIVEKIS